MAGEPLEVAWICSPPGPGSGAMGPYSGGGGAGARGHRCVIYIDDPHHCRYLRISRLSGNGGLERV